MSIRPTVRLPRTSKIAPMRATHPVRLRLVILSTAITLCGVLGSSARSQGLSDPVAAKAAAACQKAILKAGSGFGGTRLQSLEACVAGASGCVQLKPGDAACLTKAGGACAKQTAKLASQELKLTTAIDAKCTTAMLAALQGADGLNFDALAVECATLGTGGVGTLPDYEECLLRQHECGVEDMLRFEAPRAEELLGLLDPPIGLRSAFCPAPVPSATPTGPTPTATPTSAATSTHTPVATVTATRTATTTPPGPTTVSASPTPSAPTPTATPGCGNGVREAGEQCDDGNTVNLDGCDATCRFEQNQRVTFLKLQFGTDPSFCPVNHFGGAFVGGTVQGSLQSSLDGGVANGSISIVLRLLGLDDLSGAADAALAIGMLNGTPAVGSGYDGTNDVDWWYTPEAGGIDANRLPKDMLAAGITASVLTTSAPTNAHNIGFGVLGSLSMSNLTLSVTDGAVSTPLASSGSPPGHLTGEHVDPSLQSFATAGEQNLAGAGKLCADVSALSLSQTPIPNALVAGLTACNQGYTTSNSLLDALVGGCTITPGGIPLSQIASTLPDAHDPAAPAAGAGPPYTLSANAQRVVTTCKDHTNTVVDLTTCLTDAAYSAYFRFATDRVVVKN